MVVRSMDDTNLVSMGVYHSYDDSDKRLQSLLENIRNHMNDGYVNHEDIEVYGKVSVVGKANKCFDVIETGVWDKKYCHRVQYRIVGLYDGDSDGIVL